MLHKYIRKIFVDWFMAGMIAAVVLASLFPEFGSAGGAMHADKLSDIGIFMIFLFHGLGLSTQSLKDGMSRIKLHVYVQTVTFVVFPLFFAVFNLVFSGFIPKDLMLGFLYLCALPSTISSSVAMTAIAHGNVPGAIFNATLSSLLGIFLTPLIISIGISTSGGHLPLGQAILNIAILLLLPFALGQLGRPLLGKFFSRHKKTINNFDKLVILMLVYSSFCDSVKSGLWTNYGFSTILVTIFGAAVILGIILLLNKTATRIFGFNKEDEITALFCGSKKTLASGVPMAKLLFPGDPILGLIVLPIMFYHQLQLFVCAILAERYARRLKEPKAEAAQNPERNFSKPAAEQA